MATFAKANFNYLSYSASRPSYPKSLYNRILAYHSGSKNLCVDLGTGHGLVARAFAPHFAHVKATDPSDGMLAQAKELTPSTDYPNISFEHGTSDALPASIAPASVDIVVAAQAAHWFDYAKTWPELGRAVRSGGTFAIWGYSDPYFPGHPKASEVIRRYSYGDATGAETPLKGFWIDPGRTIVENRYRAVVPPPDQWADITRLEYLPSDDGSPGTGTLLMASEMKVGNLEAYVRTWSAVHRWREANPQAKARFEGGTNGDVIDWMFDEIRADEPAFRDPEHSVAIEWGTGLVMARKK